MQIEQNNNETKRRQSERRNCLQMCFHLFKYVIVHENVHFLLDFFINLL